MTFQPLLQPRGRVIHPTLIVLARAAILYSMHKGRALFSYNLKPLILLKH
jgi:hypothetical protein